MLISIGTWMGYAIVAMPAIVVVATIYLLGELRNNEQDLFEALGKPHIWFTNLNGLGFLFGFVLLGEYRSRVTDRHVKKVCFVVQSMTVIWLTTVVGFLFLAAGTAL